MSPKTAQKRPQNSYASIAPSFDLIKPIDYITQDAISSPVDMVIISHHHCTLNQYPHNTSSIALVMHSSTAVLLLTTIIHCPVPIPTCAIHPTNMRAPHGVARCIVIGSETNSCELMVPLKLRSRIKHAQRSALRSADIAGIRPTSIII